jgi:hypothetical protein
VNRDLGDALVRGDMDSPSSGDAQALMPRQHDEVEALPS